MTTTVQRSLWEQERDQLQNAVFYLERSNVDLKKSFTADMNRDLKLAFEENLVLIAKYRARVERLTSDIEQMRISLPSDLVTAARQRDVQAADQGIWL